MSTKISRTQVSSTPVLRAAPASSSHALDFELKMLGRTAVVRVSNEAASTNDFIARHFLKRKEGDSSPLVLGLDAEWKPGAAGTSTSLFQIASDEAILLVHAATFQNSDPREEGDPRFRFGSLGAASPKKLVELVLRPDLLFTGAEVGTDVSRLYTALGVPRRGNEWIIGGGKSFDTSSRCADINSYGLPALLAKPSPSLGRWVSLENGGGGGDGRLTRPRVSTPTHKPGRVGLERASRLLLGFPTWKSTSIAMSNWDTLPLGENRILYAAIDAWTSYLVYRELTRLNSLNPSNSVIDEGHVYDLL